MRHNHETPALGRLILDLFIATGPYITTILVAVALSTAMNKCERAEPMDDVIHTVESAP